jgi:hypothetical protein
MLFKYYILDISEFSIITPRNGSRSPVYSRLYRSLRLLHSSARCGSHVLLEGHSLQQP